MLVAMPDIKSIFPGQVEAIFLFQILRNVDYLLVNGKIILFIELGG